MVIQAPPASMTAEMKPQLSRVAISIPQPSKPPSQSPVSRHKNKTITPMPPISESLSEDAAPSELCLQMRMGSSARKSSETHSKRTDGSHLLPSVTHNHGCYALASADSMIVDCHIQGQPARCLIDTGATMSCVSADFIRRNVRTSNMSTLRQSVNITVADGSTCKSASCLRAANLRIHSAEYSIDLHEMPLPPKIDALLGTDFLSQNQASIQFSRDTATLTLNPNQGLPSKQANCVRRVFFIDPDFTIEEISMRELNAIVSSGEQILCACAVK